MIITEVDAFSALQGALDGFRVMPIAKAATIGDIFITVTGNKNVIDLPHMKEMKSGVILANAGHFDAEINLKALGQAAKVRRVRPFLDEYNLNGRKLFVCGEGRLVNLAAAEGHPSEVMSTSFCGQALACEYASKNRGKMKPEVIELPAQIDNMIASLQLDAMGICCDSLTAEQKKYLESWEEGT